MARAIPIQVPGLRKSHGKSPSLYQESLSPGSCPFSDHCKKGIAMTKAYSGRKDTDHFATLGLSPGTSKQEIKKAYRRLALQYHPDVCKGEHCALQFRQIQIAYEEAMSGTTLFGSYVNDYGDDLYSSAVSEGLMGVNDDSWEEWEEWMGWEGAGIRDYTSHISMHV